MKTTPFILFLTCATLVAQTPTLVTNSGSTIDSATRDAILRSAVRDFDAELTNNAKAGATNAAVKSNAPATAAPAVATTPGAEATSAPPPIPVVSAPPSTPPKAALTTPPQQRVIQAIPPAVATASAPAEQMIPPGDIQFPSMDLNTFLDFYSKLVNRTVLRAQTLPQPTITLKTQTQLTRTEAIQAFDTVLSMNGIVMINVDDKFVKAVPANQAPIEAQPMKTVTDVKDLPESDQYVSYIVTLKHVKPSEIIPVLTPVAKMPQNMLAIDTSMILIIRDFSANVKRMLELIEKVDVEVPLEYDSKVIPIRYAQAADIASALSSLGGGGGTSIGSAGGRGGIGGGLGGGGLGGVGGGTSGLGGMANGINRPGGIGGGGVSPYGSTAGTLGGAGGVGGVGGVGGAGRTSTFSDRLRGILAGAGGGAGGDFQILGRTKIIADNRTNSLLVFASKQDMEMIDKIIAQLDTFLAQVLIDSIIMEVNLDETHNIGFSYLQLNPSTAGNYKGIGAINNVPYLNANNFQFTGTNGPSVPSGFSYAAKFGDDFTATVTALETDSRVNVLSRPRIQTSHGVTASLRIGDTVPYVTGTYFGGINGQASSQYQQTFIGLDLEVTPLINSDGLVVMDILQDIQQLGPVTTIDGNPVPTTTQRTAKATVSVRDRDTIILGGFISNERTRSKSGVPFLMNVPGLGYLFRSSGYENKRVELVVLMRPTVLPTPESAAIAAQRERDRMPELKSAQAEFRKEENKRLKDTESIKIPPEKQ